MNKKALFILLLAIFLFGVCSALSYADDANKKTFNADYDTAWTACIQALADMKFVIKTTDKSSGLIQVETEAGVGKSWGGANEVIKTYTTQKVKSMSTWQAYTFDCNLILTKVDQGLTMIKLNSEIDGYNGWQDSWVTLESNGTIEKEIFEKIENKVNKLMANKAPMEKTQDYPVTVPVNFSSVPDKADIEVDGNFVAQTPATLKLKEGKHEIKVTKNGYKSWQKTIQIMKDNPISLEAALEPEK